MVARGPVGRTEHPGELPAGILRVPCDAKHESRWKCAWQFSPDFQTEHGYEIGKFCPETLTLATNWVGHTFDCLAYTIEMPFKDTASKPLLAVGWNGERSRQFGASVLGAINAVVDKL